MKKRFSSNSLGFFLIIMIISISIFTANSETSTNPDSILDANACNDCIGTYPTDLELTTFDTFPVDLDLLFWEDQPTVQAARLNDIGNGTWGWMLTPWGGHFISSHFEGADKWYFYCDRPLEMVAPASGKLSNYKVNNGTTAMINGTEVIVDVRLGINIGTNCEVEFQHLTIPVTLHDEVKDNRHDFIEGDLLGYPTEWSPDFWTIDFHYLYKDENICPYPGLSPALQDEITTLYNLQYERAKQAGVYPESKLCNDYDITVEDTIWGVWEYTDGALNDQLLKQAVRLFGQAAGGITLLSRDLTNPETFWRNMNHPTENMTSDFVGMFVDGHSNPTSGYAQVGESMVKLVDGNNAEGILELITVSYGDWGHDTSVFARFSLDTQGNGLSDDELTIEYFNSLLDAQAGFTEDLLVYQRFFGQFTSRDMILYISLGSAGLALVIIIIVVVLVVRKKKKT